MVVGQIGLHLYVQQHVELVIKFDRGKISEDRKRMKSRYFLNLEIVLTHHHYLVVLPVSVQQLTQFYVIFRILLVQVNDKFFCKMEFYYHPYISYRNLE